MLSSLSKQGPSLDELSLFVKAPVSMQKVVLDLCFLVFQLEFEVGDPALRQMVGLGRHAGPQERNPVFVEDDELGADILDGMADIVDDDPLQGRAFGLIKAGAGALDNDFMR